MIRLKAYSRFFNLCIYFINYKDNTCLFIVLPERIYVLDWVFADGPPGNARNYDNNARQDFHAILLNNMTEEEYWAEEEQWIYTRLQQDRREREETFKRKVRCNGTFMLVLFGLVCVPAGRLLS